MKKIAMFLIVLVLAAILVGCGGKSAVAGESTKKDASAAQAAQIQSGEALYQAKCAACHDPGRSAAQLNAKTLVKYKHAKGFFDFISVKMPQSAPGTLKNQEYWDLAAYIIKNTDQLPADTVLDKTSAETVVLK
jgi:cytochrome c